MREITPPTSNYFQVVNRSHLCICSAKISPCTQAPHFLLQDLTPQDHPSQVGGISTCLPLTWPHSSFSSRHWVTLTGQRHKQKMIVNRTTQHSTFPLSELWSQSTAMVALRFPLIFPWWGGRGISKHNLSCIVNKKQAARFMVTLIRLWQVAPLLGWGGYDS